MKNFVEFIVEYFIKYNIISKEMENIYRYGLEIFFLSVLEISSVLFIGLLVVGNFIETMAFFSTFIPLRLFAGGYHATTRLRCYLLLLAVYILLSLLLVIIPPTFQGGIILVMELFFSLVVICAYAPVIHQHRPINRAARIYYRKISFVICLFDSLLIMFLSFFIGNTSFTFALTLGLMFEILSILTVRFSQKRSLKLIYKGA